MSAPTIDPPPELPTFPPGRGLPDQPGVFIPKFLAFLAWFTTFRAWLVDLTAYFEGLAASGGGSGGDGEDTVTIIATGGFRPMVTGDIPPVFIVNEDGDLIMTEI
jgi:hypothetical protein